MKKIRYIRHDSDIGLKKIILKTIDGIETVSCQCCLDPLTVYIDEYYLPEFQTEFCPAAYLTYSVSFANNGAIGLACDTPEWGDTDCYYYSEFSCVPIVYIGVMKNLGMWTSSANLKVNANFSRYDCEPVTKTITMRVVYRGIEKSAQITPYAFSPGFEGCADQETAIITVYQERQLDGSYFEIV